METKQRILNRTIEGYVNNLEDKLVAFKIISVVLVLFCIIIAGLPQDTSKQDSIIVAQGLRIEVLENLNNSYCDSLEREYMGITRDAKIYTK